MSDENINPDEEQNSKTVENSEAAPIEPAAEAAPEKPAAETAPIEPAAEAAPEKPAAEAAPEKPTTTRPSSDRPSYNRPASGRPGDRRPPRPDHGGQRNPRFRKKVCRFCHDKDFLIDYKKPETIERFITDRGKILPRRVTGTCARHQRALAREIKRARILALIAFVEK